VMATSSLDGMTPINQKWTESEEESNPSFDMTFPRLCHYKTLNQSSFRDSELSLEIVYKKSIKILLGAK
jgi:hypothetical protein